jgi:hypothetical protein
MSSRDVWIFADVEQYARVFPVRGDDSGSGGVCIGFVTTDETNNDKILAQAARELAPLSLVNGKGHVLESRPADRAGLDELEGMGKSFAEPGNAIRLLGSNGATIREWSVDGGVV